MLVCFFAGLAVMHRRRREREKAIASLGIAGLAVAMYVNSLGGQFVFDDH